MASATLTKHDINVLEKIKDPESGPSAPLIIDDSLPRDPQITNPTLYASISQEERSIISSIQTIELQSAGLKPSPLSFSPLAGYLTCIQKLDSLISQHPNYASARNNRAQALRRIYGDGMLVKAAAAASSEETSLLDDEAAQPLDPAAVDHTLTQASTTIITDLSTAISLLTPLTPFSPLSPQAAKTLSQAHTQRGAVYHLTAKRLSLKGAELRMMDGSRRKEASWKVVDFEENASRDFMMGGRYGNEIAKALAVSANPTAKLCGEIVKEAMRKEYAGGM